MVLPPKKRRFSAGLGGKPDASSSAVSSDTLDPERSKYARCAPEPARRLTFRSRPWLLSIVPRSAVMRGVRPLSVRRFGADAEGQKFACQCDRLNFFTWLIRASWLIWGSVVHRINPIAPINHDL